MNPVSTGTGPSGVSTVTVWVWPPIRVSRSNTQTSCSRLSSQAAESPAMPEPITAIRLMAR